MRKSSWTPSIVPCGDDQNAYLVVDDFGRNGRVYREADVETADLETVIIDLLDGQYRDPVKVVAFHCRRLVAGRFGDVGSSAETRSSILSTLEGPWCTE